jgi:transposase, IS5 family
LRQKDRGARWTKKHGLAYSATEPCERGRQAQADPAVCRDRCGRARQQELDGLLDESNTCNNVFADSAYRSAEIEAKLMAHRSAFRLG